MNIPTEKEIEAEIETLKKMKPNVRPISILGDNNHHAIDAQIEVLEHRWSEDEVYDEYGGKGRNDKLCSDNVHYSAIMAAEWMEGHKTGLPSEDWNCLCPIEK